MASPKTTVLIAGVVLAGFTGALGIYKTLSGIGGGAPQAPTLRTSEGIVLGEWRAYTAPPKGSKPTIIPIGRRYSCYDNGAGTRYQLVKKDFGNIKFRYLIISFSDQPVTAEILITNTEAEAKAIHPDC